MAKIAPGICMLLAVTYILAFITERDVWYANEQKLAHVVEQLEEEVSISLAALTPFTWDRLYVFKPYTSKETIYDVVGYEWAHIAQTVNETMQQIVFMNGDKVVCYVYGYPKTLGYELQLTGQELPYGLILHANEQQQLRIEYHEDVVIFSS